VCKMLQLSVAHMRWCDNPDPIDTVLSSAKSPPSTSPYLSICCASYQELAFSLVDFARSFEGSHVNRSDAVAPFFACIFGCKIDLAAIYMATFSAASVSVSYVPRSVVVCTHLPARVFTAVLTFRTG
jgi:hypothetical protein